MDWIDSRGQGGGEGGQEEVEKQEGDGYHISRSQ